MPLVGGRGQRALAPLARYAANRTAHNQPVRFCCTLLTSLSRVVASNVIENTVGVKRLQRIGNTANLTKLINLENSLKTATRIPRKKIVKYVLETS